MLVGPGSFLDDHEGRRDASRPAKPPDAGTRKIAAEEHPFPLAALAWEGRPKGRMSCDAQDRLHGIEPEPLRNPCLHQFDDAADGYSCLW